MSYHTFELSSKLTNYEMFSIKDSLYKSGKTYMDSPGIIVCETLRKHGIVIKLNSFEKDDYTYNMLYYRINPRRVMEQDNYIGIFNSSDTDVMLNAVDEYLRSISCVMPTVDMMKLSRIDFCSNIRLSSGSEVKEYMKILHRGMTPHKYTLNVYYSKSMKKYVIPKNSIVFSYRNRMMITYYNKYQQIKSVSYIKNPEEARDIVRAEIQCGKHKVRHLADKFGCTSVRNFLRHSDEISEYIFKKYANLSYGNGCFYKIDEIQRRIENSRFHKKSKKMMYKLVSLSAKHSSLEKAMNELDLTGKKRKEIMKRFDKIGASPVVIPRRCEYDSFENPLTLALKWCDNL